MCTYRCIYILTTWCIYICVLSISFIVCSSQGCVRYLCIYIWTIQLDVCMYIYIYMQLILSFATSDAKVISLIICQQIARQFLKFRAQHVTKTHSQLQHVQYSKFSTFPTNRATVDLAPRYQMSLTNKLPHINIWVVEWYSDCPSETIISW